MGSLASRSDKSGNQIPSLGAYSGLIASTHKASHNPYSIETCRTEGDYLQGKGQRIRYRYFNECYRIVNDTDIQQLWTGAKKLVSNN